MAGCSSCAGRRKVIAQVISGKTSLASGTKAVVGSIKTDFKRIAARPSKTGLRVK